MTATTRGAASAAAPDGGPTERLTGPSLGIAVGIGVVALFDAFWRLGVADWKTDEAWDGRLAWQAVDGGDWSPANGHPVFVRWFLGLGQLLFGENRIGIRLAPAIASVVAVWLLFVLGRRLHSQAAGLIAAGLWAVLPRALVVGHVVVGPLRGDRFAYLEPFMVVALLGATLTGWNWVRGGRMRDALATGLLIGLGSAFKPTALVVLLPIVAIAAWERRSVRPVLAGAAAMAAVAVIVLPLTYLPLGTQGPEALRALLDFQLDHARTGHPLVVDGTLTQHQPRWSHLLYQWRGMGWAACTALVIGVAGAWTGRQRRPIAFVSAIWLSLLGLHLLSSVALPHYYLLWAPFGVLVAAMGFVELGRRSAAPAGTTDGGSWSRRTEARWRCAPGPSTALLVAAVLLLGAGIRSVADTAALPHGDYGAMVQQLDDAGVEPSVVRHQGEAVERYFPDAGEVGQIGFSDPSVPFDVLVLDPRDVPMLPPENVEAVRKQAANLGLTPHRIGRLEVWYAEPS